MKRILSINTWSYYNFNSKSNKSQWRDKEVLIWIKILYQGSLSGHRILVEQSSYCLAVQCGGGRLSNKFRIARWEVEIFLNVKCLFEVRKWRPFGAGDVGTEV